LIAIFSPLYLSTKVEIHLNRLWFSNCEANNRSDCSEEYCQIIFECTVELEWEEEIGSKIYSELNISFYLKGENDNIIFARWAPNNYSNTFDPATPDNFLHPKLTLHPDYCPSDNCRLEKDERDYKKIYYNGVKRLTKENNIFVCEVPIYGQIKMIDTIEVKLYMIEACGINL